MGHIHFSVIHNSIALFYGKHYAYLFGEDVNHGNN